MRRAPFTTAATSDGASYRAIANPARASFWFPKPEPRTWYWHNPDVPGNNQEFGWTVTVVNGGSSFEFGFFLYKFADSVPATGDLSALLGAGQMSVFAEDGRVLPEARVDVSIQEEGLLLGAAGQFQRRSLPDRPRDVGHWPDCWQNGAMTPTVLRSNTG